MSPAINAGSPPSPEKDTRALRTAGLADSLGARTAWTRRPSARVWSLIYQTARAQKRQDGPCVDLDSPTRASRTHCRLYIGDLGYAAAPLAAHIRPHLRDTSQLPPFAVHKLLRQIQAQSQGPNPSPSKSKFGTHRVIDFGQLPFPSILSLPAAPRPAAVCEPTCRTKRQLATFPSIHPPRLGAELPLTVHLRIVIVASAWERWAILRRVRQSHVGRVPASRAARGQARCVSISCTPSSRQSPGLVTEKVASPLITPECPCGFARSYRRHGLYSSNLDISWKWHTGLLNLSYLDHLRPSFAVGNTAQAVPLHRAAHTPTWLLSSNPRSSKMASGLRGPRTSTTC